MEKLTKDLKGVAESLDDILVSGYNAEEHLRNLRILFQRLQDKGLRCRLEKCSFAQSSIEYRRLGDTLGNTLSQQGICKGSKVEAVLKMPPPSDVSNLRSFLGSFQFYAKSVDVIRAINLSHEKRPTMELETQRGSLFSASRRGSLLRCHSRSFRPEREDRNVMRCLGCDTYLDVEEEKADVRVVCEVRDLSLRLDPIKPNLLHKESGRDPNFQILRYVIEGWPRSDSTDTKHFKKLEDFLTVDNGCLFYGTRVVIPTILRPKVLRLLHHFGMQRMKQLARSAVYWPHIDEDIERIARLCHSCVEHQNRPPKPTNRPWILPEKPWSRLHMDHAINFLGTNWLVLIDAYSKYP
ncbi:hypothetical protein J437_LFUL014361, partial [Ladona fulva]